MSLLWIRANRSQRINELGESEHPDVTNYYSGGIGHREDSGSRSVVGFMPTKLMKHYREHDGNQNPHDDTHDRKVVEGVKNDILSGEGIHEPIVMDYDHKNKWGYISEGNHRLAGADEAGAKTVPMRVWGRGPDLGDKKAKGIGGPVHLDTEWKNSQGKEYIPPDIHPHHFTYGKDDGDE